MATTHTLTGQVSNLIGEFDAERIALAEVQGYVEASQPLVNDPDLNQQRYGRKRLTFAEDGTWEVEGLVATGEDTVAAYRVVVFFHDGAANSSLVQVTSNWFELTTDKEFGSVVAVELTAVNTEVLQTIYAVRDQVVGFRDDAADSATEAGASESAAETAAGIATAAAAAADALVITDLGTSDGQVKALLDSPSSLAKASLLKQFVPAIGLTPSGDTTGVTDTANWKAAIVAAFTYRVAIRPAPGEYVIKEELILKPSNSGSGNVPAFVPSIIGPAGAGRIGDELDTDSSAVVLKAHLSFPQGKFLIDYQQNGTPYAGTGAIVRGFVLECETRSAGFRAQGIRESRLSQLSIINSAVPVSPGDGAKGGFSMTFVAGGGNAGAYNIIEQVTCVGWLGDAFFDNTSSENTYIGLRAFTGQNDTSAAYHVDSTAGGASSHTFIDCHYGGGAYGVRIGPGSSGTFINMNLFHSVPWPKRNALLIEDGWQYNLTYYEPPKFIGCRFVNHPQADPDNSDGALLRFKNVTGDYQIDATFTACVFGMGYNEDRGHTTPSWAYADAGLEGKVTFRDCTFLGTPDLAPTLYEDIADILWFFNCKGVPDNRGMLSGEAHANTNSAALTPNETQIDIPNTTVTFTAPRAGTLMVNGNFDFNVVGADFLIGHLRVDGATDALVALFSGTANRTTVSRSWSVPVAAGSHTFKLRASQASGSGTSTTNALHTGLTWLFVPNP